jgi:hypothetical protein
LIATVFFFLPKTALRVCLAPFLAFEAYFMSATFACIGSLNMMSRAPVAGTGSACGPGAYNHYLDLNFGLNHWYIMASYAGIALFMLWPIVKAMTYTNRQTLEQNAAAEVEWAKYRARIQQIEKVD